MKQETVPHFWGIKYFSFLYSYYAIADTAEHLSARILDAKDLNVWLEEEAVDLNSSYRLLLCKCRKKDAEAVEHALEALPNHMLLCGHQDYLSYCDKINRGLEKAAQK